MQEVYTFAVVGGDERQLYSARFLEEKGFSVKTFGFEKKTGEAHDIKELSNCRNVILPLPLSRDGVNLNAPFSDKKIKLLDIFSAVSEKSTVFGGMMKSEYIKILSERGIAAHDYFKCEELIIKNAVPTAEGVLQTVMENMDKTVYGSSFGITGFGRTAKVIANTLKSLGADVTIFARRTDDRVWAELGGFKALQFSELNSAAGEFDVFINTVPVSIISENTLHKFRKECLLVEIASAPGGFPKNVSQNEELRYINPGSLPGKVAPKTAGEIIAKVILNLLKGEKECSH